MKKSFAVIVCVAVLVLLLAGCSNDSSTESDPYPPGTTDEMWSEPAQNVELEVYRDGDHVYTADTNYDITEYISSSELEEGKRYKLIVDVTYLNGGVAGYVDYPQINRIISIEEMSSSEQPGEGEQDQTPDPEPVAAGTAETAKATDAAVPIKLLIDGAEVAVAWEDNESVAALQELASTEPLEAQMSMYGGFEQVGSLGADLPRNDEQTTTSAGDIVLYQGNQIVVFYGSNSWAYTRLGHIEGMAVEELAQLLGEHNVVLTLG